MEAVIFLTRINVYIFKCQKLEKCDFQYSFFDHIPFILISCKALLDRYLHVDCINGLDFGSTYAIDREIISWSWVKFVKTGHG